MVKKKMKILRTNVNMIWRRKKSISGQKGGVVWVGDHTRGISDVTILPDTMFDKIDVNFSWKTDGLLIGRIEISPHEIKQIDPIRIRLSYKDAELTDINENRIKLCRYNEENYTWEPIKSRIDKSRKRVVGFVDQSSWYALAVS